jgi:hypothetical protein
MVLIPPLGPYKSSLFLAAVDRHIYGFWKKMTFKTFAYTVILYSGWAESCTLRGCFLMHWNLLRIWSANKGKSRTSKLPQSGQDLGKLIIYIVFLKEYLYSNLVALHPSKKVFCNFWLPKYPFEGMKQLCHYAILLKKLCFLYFVPISVLKKKSSCVALNVIPAAK